MTSDGTKVPLGLGQGSTENAALCASLLQGVLGCGLKLEDKVVFIMQRAESTPVEKVPSTAAESLPTDH